MRVKNIELNFLGICFIIFLFNFSISNSYCADYSVWFEQGTKKVFQNDSPQNIDSFRIYSAKNEFEPVQMIIHSNLKLENIDVNLGNFSNQNGDIINVNMSTTNLIGYLNVSNPSNYGVKLGMWPEMIIPKVDSYYHEKRNTFPITVEPNINSVILFDVFVPNSTKPGNYISIVNIIQDGTLIEQKQINLTVWNFTLPVQPNLKFTTNAGSLEGGHYGDLWSYDGSIPSYKLSINLYRDYMKAALKNKLEIEPFSPSFSGWNGTDYGSIGTMYFDGTSKDFFTNENNVLGIEYGPVKLNSLFFRMDSDYREYANCSNPNATLPDEEFFLKAEARFKYWNKTLPPELKNNTYVLPLDEAGAGEVGCGYLNPQLDYNTVKEASKLIRKYGFKVVTTNSIRDSLLNTSNDPPTNDYIDLWVAYHNSFIGLKWDGTHIDKSDIYKEPLLNGAKFWWYTGCGTHGCGIVGGTECLDYIQYIVEYPSMHARVMPWLNYKYNITGIIYYATTLNYNSQNKDPWNSLWSNYKGNGDGNLFYPGVPNTTDVGLPVGTRGLHTPSIGGEHHIPIDSFRLKVIRESIEDYEYLYLLGELGEKDLAKEKIALLANHTYDFEKNISKLYDVRKDIGDKIESLIGTAFLRELKLSYLENRVRFNLEFSDKVEILFNISGNNYSQSYIFNNNNSYEIIFDNLELGNKYNYSIIYCSSGICKSTNTIEFKMKDFFINYNETYWNKKVTNFNDLSEIELNNISDVKFEREFGEILYLEPLNLNRTLNLNNNIIIEKSKIIVNSNLIPEFNKSARLSFYNLNFTKPLILKNNNVCKDCNFISYLDGTLIFNVTSFSEYEIVEDFCGDEICSSSESCSICSNDCGVCSSSDSKKSSSGSSRGSSSSSFLWFQNDKNFSEKCVEDWSCGVWSDCINLTRNRLCTEINKCGKLNYKREYNTCEDNSSKIISVEYLDSNLIKNDKDNEIKLENNFLLKINSLLVKYNYLIFILIVIFVLIIFGLVLKLSLFKSKYKFNEKFIKSYSDKLVLVYPEEYILQYKDSIKKLKHYVNSHSSKNLIEIKAELIKVGWSQNFLNNIIIEKKNNL